MNKNLILILSLITTSIILFPARMTVYNETTEKKLVNVTYGNNKNTGYITVLPKPGKVTFNTGGLIPFKSIIWKDDAPTTYQDFKTNSDDKPLYKAEIPSSAAMLMGSLALFGDDRYGINFDAKGAHSNATLKQALTCYDNGSCGKENAGPARPQKSAPETPSKRDFQQQQQPTQLTLQELLQIPEVNYFITKDFEKLTQAIIQQKIYGDDLATKTLLLVQAFYKDKKNEPGFTNLKTILETRINPADVKHMPPSAIAETQTKIKNAINAFFFTLKTDYQEGLVAFKDPQPSADVIQKYLQ